MRYSVLLLGAIALTVAGCSGERDVRSEELSSPLAIPDSYKAVAYFSTPVYETDERGVLAVIDDQGSVATIDVGALENGKVASGPSLAVTFSSDTTTITRRGEDVDVWRRGGRQDTGHWAGFSKANQAISVFNTGKLGDTYTTDVFVSDGSRRSHSVVPDVPGAVGISDSTLWVLSGGSSNADGRVTLYGIDLGSTNARPTTSEWEFFGARRGMSFSDGSGIVDFRGRLWYLEELAPPGGGPGEGLDLRLAEVDPEKATYRSRHLATTRRYLYDDRDGVNPVAAAARQGHLFRGTLYTVDGNGRILGVDLLRATVEVTGHLSLGARSADRAAVAWSGREMNVLYSGGSGDRMTLETYDIRSGTRLSAKDVTMPPVITDDPDLLLASMAVSQD